MATVATIPGIEGFIKQKVVTERNSYEFVSDELRRLYPTVRGLSARSVRRFCKEHDFHSTARLTDHQLDSVVTSFISKVNDILTSYCSD
jgi:hypothetical protein